jgi:hypothetical protein
VNYVVPGEKNPWNQISAAFAIKIVAVEMTAACVRTFGKSISGFDRKGTDKSIASCVASAAAWDSDVAKSNARSKKSHTQRLFKKHTGYKHMGGNRMRR